MRSPTLRLTWPFGQTLLLSTLFLALLLGMAEAMVRSPYVQSRLIPPSLNSRHRQFEVQWYLLAAAAAEGPLECIVLGNSMVWRGFDPVAFSQAHRTESGRGLRCFNFGVDALPAAAAGPLARLLVEEYRPRLLIYGIDARDFAVAYDAEDALVILDMAWLRYRLGRFNLEGWLVQHSLLYRYRRHFHSLTRFDYEDALASAQPPRPAPVYGFAADDTVGRFVTTTPDPEDDGYHVAYYFGLLSDYRVRPENLAGLEQVLDQQGDGRRVIVVEMPIPETYHTFFGNWDTDYQEFVDQVSQRAIAAGVTYWQATPRPPIPDDGWVDYSHLNRNGARIFSDWLGHQVGQASALGQTSP